jgi:hypothetical protein
MLRPVDPNLILWELVSVKSPAQFRAKGMFLPEYCLYDGPVACRLFAVFASLLACAFRHFASPYGLPFSPGMICTSINMLSLMSNHKTTQIAALHMKMLTGFLPLPANSLYQRVIEPDSSGLRAMSHTATSVPTFIRK